MFVFPFIFLLHRVPLGSHSTEEAAVKLGIAAALVPQPLESLAHEEIVATPRLLGFQLVFGLPLVQPDALLPLEQVLADVLLGHLLKGRHSKTKEQNNTSYSLVLHP